MWVANHLCKEALWRRATTRPLGSTECLYQAPPSHRACCTRLTLSTSKQAVGTLANTLAGAVPAHKEPYQQVQNRG